MTGAVAVSPYTAEEVRRRHHVQVEGEGAATLVFAHGFGCDQTMWRRLVPRYAGRFRTVLYDLMGMGRSHLPGYDRGRYASLHGHADDLLDVIAACAEGPVVFVGHSVGAMVGLLAGLRAPGRFTAQVMVSPSPCYIDEGGYVGGFSRADIDGLLETLDSNHLGWSSAMAPRIMGAPDQPELGAELTHHFCRTDPDIARHFARVTFLSDHRADAPRLAMPVLVLQCSDDVIAPRTAGDFLLRSLPQGELALVDNVGHCPHLSAPGACADAMDAFLARVLAPRP